MKPSLIFSLCILVSCGKSPRPQQGSIGALDASDGSIAGSDTSDSESTDVVEGLDWGHTDIMDDLPPGDDVADATDVTVFPPPPGCENEPVPPDVGSACGKLGEFHCSNRDQATNASAHYLTPSGSSVWANDCRRNYIVRCEATPKGNVWVERWAKEEAEQCDSNLGPKDYWCQTTPTGAVAEMGYCYYTNGVGAPCPAEWDGKIGCSSISHVAYCGYVDDKPAGSATAESQYEEKLPCCKKFRRTQIVSGCTKTIVCANPKVGPGLIIDRISGQPSAKDKLLQICPPGLQGLPARRSVSGQVSAELRNRE